MINNVLLCLHTVVNIASSYGTTKMDILTSAADAILNDKGNIFTPFKNIRPALRNVTNATLVYSPKKLNSCFNALFSEKITCTAISNTKINNHETPRKRRKRSLKFGDENQAPSPKTPKSEKMEEKFIDSPITPLSNLKMLTRIASMEEPIPSKKNLFETPNVSLKSKLGLRRCISESVSHQLQENEATRLRLKRFSTSSDLEHSGALKASKNCNILSVTAPSEFSRREKSLGLLCERFLDHFPIEVSCLETPRRLVIDDVAAVLGTGRRRVYDIVNILECLNMASRVQKNMYQWMGKQHLEATLSKLKGLAEQWGIGVHLSSPIEQSLRDLKTENIPGDQTSDKQEARKEKSIGILCQKFLMLFLTSSPPHIIQLDTAIHLLLGQEGDDIEKLRTRGRRIYDIANVLVSLHLIKKLPHCKSFMYVGPQVEATKAEDAHALQSQVKLRHSLLPPPLIDLIHKRDIQGLVEDPVVTPSDNENFSSRRGRPRKLDSEFLPSRAKRNCLVNQTQSEEIKLALPQSQENLRCSSLQNICKVAEVEREKLKKDPHAAPLSKVSTQGGANQAAQKQIPLPRQTFRFSHFGSPRMALTFQSSPSRSPPVLTSKPPVASSTLPRVLVRPPFILRTLNVSNPRQQTPNGIQKPLYVIHTTVNNSQNSQILKSDAASPGSLVHSPKEKNMRTLSLPAVNSEVTAAPFRKYSDQQRPKEFVKYLSQTNLPNISLNTLSRNHYKTVFGSSVQIPSIALSSPTKTSYRFVISTKDSEQQSSAACSNSQTGEKEAKQPSFIKIFQTSPDNSSTDSELESIFGDSFRFTRPKNLVNK